LQQSLGQAFFVENRAGAAGRIGTAVAAKSDPDGHTLLMTTESSLVIAPHMVAGLIPHIRAGALKCLAVGSKERSPALPEVPTVAEAGVPGYEATSWIGLLAPATTPQSVIDRLWQAVREAMADGEVREILGRDGAEIVVSTPQGFRQTIEADDAKYAGLADLLKAAQ
jgi:tripartite-type tricarboxylate transporter receptor subunit TctC